jgi:hypothetical protein
VEPGQLVDVNGTSAGGDFAPIIDKATARVIGRASLPAPIRCPSQSYSRAGMTVNGLRPKAPSARLP